MPSLKEVIKMSVQVVAAVVASTYAANVVGSLFDRLTSKGAS